MKNTQNGQGWKTALPSSPPTSAGFLEATPGQRVEKKRVRDKLISVMFYLKRATSPKTLLYFLEVGDKNITNINEESIIKG